MGFLFGLSGLEISCTLFVLVVCCWCFFLSCRSCEFFFIGCINGSVLFVCIHLIGKLLRIINLHGPIMGP